MINTRPALERGVLASKGAGMPGPRRRRHHDAFGWTVRRLREAEEDTSVFVRQAPDGVGRPYDVNSYDNGAEWFMSFDQPARCL